MNSQLPDLNRLPALYEGAALPGELSWQINTEAHTSAKCTFSKKNDYRVTYESSSSAYAAMPYSYG